ncbi:MAG: sigma-70 family RNA polymerase sigma factor [Parcubacteria group bacterium]
MEKADRQLIEEFLDGSDDSFEYLVGRYLKPVYNFLYQFTQDRDSLDDLTQETFIKAWKNIKKFDPEKNFRTWLFTIAKNTAYDFLKKKKTLPFSDFLDEAGNNRLENVVEDGPRLEEVLAGKDLARELEKKLQEIPDSYRILLLMRYKDGFSLQEIAQILDLPYNTVKSQHARALASLKKTWLA